MGAACPGRAGMKRSSAGSKATIYEFYSILFTVRLTFNYKMITGNR
jgi:hypothetical protein